MSHDELSIRTTHEHGGDTIVFRMNGSLDVATAPTARATLIEESANVADVVVDLTGLEFIDSTGLGALIGAHRRALERNGKVRLVAREGPIARLLHITGLVRVFTVYPTFEAALADRPAVSVPA